MMLLDRRRAATSGGELAYLDLGDPDAPAVVLLHGFPTSADLWRSVAPVLATRMRVVAPDLLGYGESAKPGDADLSIRGQAGVVRELLGGLGIERAAVVGHDVGGGVAQLLALEGLADALVLVDTICFDAWPIEAVRLLQASTPEQETAERAERVIRLVLDAGVKRHERLAEADVERFVAPWRADPRALFRAARALDGEGLAGREAELAALEVPAFVLWGEEDAFIAAELAERMGDALPDALVALLPGCGHFVMLDAPETVGPLLYEFLRTRYLGEAHAHAAPTGPVPVFLERPPAGFDAPELEE